MSEELTSSALLEQLVYIDNYINGTQPNTDSSTATPNIDVDGQLSLDLAAFADDSFIFPDEDKPKPLYDHEDDGEDDGEEEDVDEIGQAEGVRRRIGDKKRNKDANFASSGNNDGLNGWNIHEFNSSNLVPTIKQEPEVGSSHLYFRNLNGEDDDGHEDRLNEFNLLLSHANNGDTGLPHGLMDAFHNSSNKNITNGKNNDVHGHDLDTQHQHHHHRHVQPHKLLSLNELPKFPVPPGAKNSLVSAGLSLNQIDLLSALIAQHQTNLGKTISQQQHRGSAGEPNDDGDLGVETINSFMVKQQQQQQQQQAPVSSTSTSSNLPLNMAPITPNAAASLSPADVPTRQLNASFQLPSQGNPHASLSSSTATAAAAQTNSGLQLLTRSRNPSVTSFIDPSLQQQQSQLQRNGSVSGAYVAAAPSSVTTASSNMSLPDAAELDKKRRNTAASARFRIKKKMKEQQMENKISSLQDMISSLENKLSHLEMENKLLRNLIIEKGSQKSDDELKLLKEKAKQR